MEQSNGKDSSFHLAMFNSNDLQAMLSEFQAHSQTYFDFMNVLFLFLKTTTDVIEFNQASEDFNGVQHKIGRRKSKSFERDSRT